MLGGMISVFLYRYIFIDSIISIWLYRYFFIDIKQVSHKSDSKPNHSKKGISEGISERISEGISEGISERISEDRQLDILGSLSS